MKKIVVYALVISNSLNIQLVFAEEKQACTCGHDLCGDSIEGLIVREKDEASCSCNVKVNSLKLNDCVAKKKSEQIAVAVTEDSKDSNFWGVVGLKIWGSTFSGVGNSNKTSTGQMSLTAGYEKVFFNVSLSAWNSYKISGWSVDPSNQSTLLHGQSSINLGYLVSPELSVTLGRRNLGAGEFENFLGQKYFYISNGDRQFATVGAAFNHKFKDSKFLINGVIAYGKYTLKSLDGQGVYTFTGTTSGSGTFLSYELGGSYVLSQAWKLNAFYRVEQWDALVPSSVGVTNIALAINKLKESGPGIGVSWGF